MVITCKVTQSILPILKPQQPPHHHARDHGVRGDISRNSCLPRHCCGGRCNVAYDMVRLRQKRTPPFYSYKYWALAFALEEQTRCSSGSERYWDELQRFGTLGRRRSESESRPPARTSRTSIRPSSRRRSESESGPPVGLTRASICPGSSRMATKATGCHDPWAAWRQRSSSSKSTCFGRGRGIMCKSCYTTRYCS